MLNKLYKKIKNFLYYQRIVLYGYDLNKVHNFESMKRYTFHVASVKDLEETYVDEVNTDLRSISLSLWKKKITEGLWKGFMCKDGQMVVAQAFFSVEDAFFGGTKWVVLTMPPNSAYGFKLYTRPDYRGQKLGQAITSFRLNSAKNGGVERFYTVINSGNEVSRHNEEKIGGYLIGSVIFVKCRFFNIVLISPYIYMEGFRPKEIRRY